MACVVFVKSVYTLLDENSERGGGSVGRSALPRLYMSSLLSVIIPVYNVETFVAQCVESVIAQTYDNLEIILVDDGSTDRSGVICDEFAARDRRIRVIHKVNGGLSDARNAGIEVAAGQYLGFVDSDDWIEPNMYELLYNACAGNEADLSVCGLFRDYKDRAISCPNKKAVLSSSEAMRALIEGEDLHDHAWSKLYRRSLFDGVRYPVRQLYEDVRTTYKLVSKANKVVMIPECLYHYRQRKGSIVRKNNNINTFQLENAFEEMISDSSGDFSRYQEAIDFRRLKLQSYILRELLLSDKSAVDDNRERFDRYASLVRENRKQILRDPRFTKVYKLIGIASMLPEKAFRGLFHTAPIQRYLADRYNYY